MEAQRFPKDYDGIVAGAPANAWTKLLANAICDRPGSRRDAGQLDLARKAPVVTDAALKACHGENGILDDPGHCHFDPSSLVCARPARRSQCLSAPRDHGAEARSIRACRTPSGKTIFPGYPPGGESGPTAWSLWITGTEPKRIAGTLINGFGTGYFANMVFDKADWDFHGQNVADDLAQAQEKTGKDARRDRSGSQRLQARRAASCCSITAGATRRSRRQSSINYYESVAAKMGGIDNYQVLLSAVHGAGHAALRRRPRPQRGRGRVRHALAEPRPDA